MAAPATSSDRGQCRRIRRNGRRIRRNGRRPSRVVVGRGAMPSDRARCRSIAADFIRAGAPSPAAHTATPLAVARNSFPAPRHASWVYPRRMAPPASPIDVFLSYAHDDATLLQELEKHLVILRSEGMIRSFHSGNVSAGEDWRAAVDGHLDRADVILALVSADFLASNLCYEVDLAKALARHQAGKAVGDPRAPAGMRLAVRHARRTQGALQGRAAGEELGRDGRGAHQRGPRHSRSGDRAPGGARPGVDSFLCNRHEWGAYAGRRRA